MKEIKTGDTVKLRRKFLKRAAKLNCIGKVKEIFEDNTHISGKPYLIALVDFEGLSKRIWVKNLETVS